MHRVATRHSSTWSATGRERLSAAHTSTSAANVTVGAVADRVAPVADFAVPRQPRGGADAAAAAVAMEALA